MQLIFLDVLKLIKQEDYFDGLSLKYSKSKQFSKQSSEKILETHQKLFQHYESMIRIQNITSTKLEELHLKNFKIFKHNKITPCQIGEKLKSETFY